MENKHLILILICYIIFIGSEVVRTISFNCTFDDGLCKWSRFNNNNKFKLTWGRQNSSTSKIGPDSDHTSGVGNFLYINSSNESANRNARLKTPWKTTPGKYCLSLWYYMYGRDTDRLQVAVKEFKEDRTILRTISNISNNLRGMWILQTEVFVAKKKRFRIFIDGLIENDEQDFGYIAVDDVEMFTEKCPTNCSDPTPAFGKAVVGEIWEGSTVNIECREGYDVIGNSTIVCQDNGKWSDTPSCQSVECTKPILTTGLLEPNGTTWYPNQFVLLACADGNTLRGNAKITCQESGNWTILPTCDYNDESVPGDHITVAVTIPLLLVCIPVIIIVVVCRKRKRGCLKGDKTCGHDMNWQSQYSNDTYNNSGLNADTSTTNESHRQDTEYAVISRKIQPEMKEDVYYDPGKYGVDFRNNSDYDHIKTSFKRAFDNTYSHLIDNDNDLKNKPSKHSTDSYSYTNAAFQEIDDENNHINLDRPKESRNQNIKINSYQKQESDYDHAKAGGCDPITLDLDGYSYLNTTVKGQE